MSLAHAVQHYALADLVGFGAGLTLAGQLLYMVFPRRSTSTEWTGRTTLALSLAVWNLGGFIGTAALALSADPSHVMRTAAANITNCALALFPVSFLEFLRKESADGSPSSAKKWLRWVATLTFIGVAGMTVVEPVINLHSSVSQFVVAMTTSGISIGGLLAYRRVLFQRPIGWLFALVAAVCLFSAGVDYWSAPDIRAVPPELALRFVRDQSSIVLTLFACWVFSQFRLGDLLATRSVRILLAVASSALLLNLGIQPFEWEIRSLHSLHFPDAILFFGLTAILTLFVLTFGLADRWLSYLIQRVLYRQPDYSSALNDLRAEIRQYETDDRIYRAMEQFLHNFLQFETVCVLPPGAVTDQRALGRILAGETYEINPSTTLSRSLIPNTAIEVLIPIRVEAHVQTLIAAGPGVRRHGILQSEISFLEAVANWVGTHMDARRIEVEREKRQLMQSRLEHQIVNAELRALRAQINPHFLFNSLNSVAALVRKEPRQAEHMLLQLSDTFRHIQQNSERQLVTIAEEFDFVSRYLDIEKIRFGKRLRVEMRLDEDVRDTLMPSLLLQPLVENALKHGFGPKITGGCLSVSATRNEDRVQLRVEDDGVGVTSTQQVPESGTGLRNVRERLCTLYGNEAEMTLAAPAGGGYNISILMPLRSAVLL